MQAIVDKWVQGNNLQHCCVANGGIYSVKTTNNYTNRSASDCIDLLGAETYLLS